MLLTLCAHLLIGGNLPLETPLDVKWRAFCERHVCVEQCEVCGGVKGVHAPQCPRAKAGDDEG